MKMLKIPEATVSRLSVYSRFLSKLNQKGIITISSGEIAEGVGVSAAQVRKDLAYFGEFGTRGVGYNVKDLHQHILKILGLTTEWPIVVVGAGNLGRALCLYDGFRERGFDIVAMIDVDPLKIGEEIEGVTVYSLENLREIIIEKKVKMGVIAVPAEYAQQTADLLVENNVSAILNFAPAVIKVPEEVQIRNVDLAVNLEILTFNIGNSFHSLY